MSIDKQGKNTGDTAPNKGNQRANENRPSGADIDRQIKKTKDAVRDTLEKK